MIIRTMVVSSSSTVLFFPFLETTSSSSTTNRIVISKKILLLPSTAPYRGHPLPQSSPAFRKNLPRFPRTAYRNLPRWRGEDFCVRERLDFYAASEPRRRIHQAAEVRMVSRHVSRDRGDGPG